MAFKAYEDQFDGRLAGLVEKYFELRMLRLQGERLADIVLTRPRPRPRRPPAPTRGTRRSACAACASVTPTSRSV